MRKDITELFCFVDDFCKSTDSCIEKERISTNQKVKNATRSPDLTISEIMTIMILFQEYKFRNFKSFYAFCKGKYIKEFPKMPSYERFNALMPRALYLLVILLCSMMRRDIKIAFMDSTSLNVCHPKRIKSNKVFKGLAKIGKSTKGWFFGFKLHIVIDPQGNLMNVKITKENTDDRTPVLSMTEGMQGFLFADKGYISKELFLKLIARGLKLVTGIKNNMKNMLMFLDEKLLLKKRYLVESVFNYLKNYFSIEHNRHRSFINMLVHIISTLVAYQLPPKKPHLREFPQLI